MLGFKLNHFSKRGPKNDVYSRYILVSSAIDSAYKGLNFPELIVLLHIIFFSPFYESSVLVIMIEYYFED